jgi:hypothetical protein
VRRLWRNLLILAAIPPALIIVLLGVGGIIHHYQDDPLPAIGSKEFFELLIGAPVRPEEIYYCDNYPTFGFDGTAVFIYKMSEEDLMATRNNALSDKEYPKIVYNEDWNFRHWAPCNSTATEKELLGYVTSLGQSCLETYFSGGYSSEMIFDLLNNCMYGKHVYIAYESYDSSDRFINFILYILNLDQRILVITINYV